MVELFLLVPKSSETCCDCVNLFQGEVEQIAMMKPKAPNESEDGMLEFLEDIIGSSRYQQPITLLAKRVEELNELRCEKVISCC